MTIPANWKADHSAHAGALAFAGARPLTNWHNVTPEVAAQAFPSLDLTDLLDFGQLGVERGTIAAALTVFLQTLAHQSDRQICWCPVHIRKSLSSSPSLSGSTKPQKASHDGEQRNQHREFSHHDSGQISQEYSHV